MTPPARCRGAAAITAITAIVGAVVAIGADILRPIRTGAAIVLLLALLALLSKAAVVLRLLLAVVLLAVILLAETAAVVLLLAAVVTLLALVALLAETGIVLLLLLALIVASLTGFVAVRIEEAFHFGVFLIVRLFLQTNFDLERNVVQLLGVSDVEHADTVTQGRKLLVSNFDSLLRSAIQVEPDRAGSTFIFTIRNHSLQNRHTGITIFGWLDFGLNNYNVVRSDRKASATVLGRVKLSCVERLQQIHDITF